MDSPVRHEPQAAPPLSHCRHHQIPRPAPPPHHHHHFHVSPHCPLHNHLIHLRNHSPTCPIFSSLLPNSPNLETLVGPSVLFPTNPQAQESTMSMPNEEETVGMEEEEEDDDPVFVMTDEWMEFFAKSEAKRRLAKQARRKGKKTEP